MLRADAPLVFVGAATLDVIAVVSGFLAADERREAEALEVAGGGPAGTAAVACARLGIAAAFVGAVGDDDEGERIAAGLMAEGVDVSGLCRVPGARSGLSIVVSDRVNGTRSICTRQVPPLELTSRGIELVQDAAWVHVDHLGWDPVTAYLGSTRTYQRLSVDGGNPIPGFAPHYADLWVPTLGALRDVFGDAPIDSLLDAALAAGARTVIATKGADGAVGASRTGERVAAPAFATDIVSTLGAGDVFHGALLAAIVREYPLQRCLYYASAAAGLSCRGLDGRSTIPSHLEVVAAMENGFGSRDAASVESSRTRVPLKPGFDQRC